MVTAEYPDEASGGLGYHVYYLSRALAARGHDVHLVASVRRPPAMDPPPGVEVHFVPFFQGLLVRNVLWTGAAKLAVRRLSAAGTPDIVHAHAPMCSAYPLAHDPAIPLATTFHSLFLSFRRIPETNPARLLQSRVGEIVDRTSLGRSDVVIACNHSVRDEIAGSGFPLERVVVVPNGVALEEFGAQVPPEAVAAVRRRYHFPTRARIVLSVGELVARKGVNVLIDAMRVLDRSHPDAFGLVIVGDGADRGQLEAAARDLERIVVFAGRVPLSDLRTLYHAADLFAMPSYYEGLPTVVLEALASGLPVIGADIPAMHGLLGRCGLLVERRAEAFAEGIAGLLEDPARIDEMRAAARDAAAPFAWSRLAEATERAYEAAIARAR